MAQQRVLQLELKFFSSDKITISATIPKLDALNCSNVTAKTISAISNADLLSKNPV